MINNKEKIIVALDGFPTIESVLLFVDTLGDAVVRYKIGLEVFIKFGMSVVNYLSLHDKKVFLDLKIEDIPETVKLAIMALADKVEFTTLRGDYNVIQAAIDGLTAANAKYPKLLWVPILSSQYGEYILSPMMEIAPFYGIVTSGVRIIQFRKLFPKIIIVAPGIRMLAEGSDDHAVSTTPEQAIAWGADYLVIGRPITKATNPVEKVQEIIERIK
ncbi:MAG: orotidine-5'-phosphate decarboxylase [Thermodesulfobacteriota bacterium]